MLVNWVNIGSGNDFLDIWHQITTLIIANFLPFEPGGGKPLWNSNKKYEYFLSTI